jgi:tetratricopeptide (TPR) repeat protein
LILWNWGDPADSERRFLELSERVSAEADLAYHQEVLTQVARALALQAKFAEGHALLDTIAREEDTAALDALSPLVAVRVILERGRIHNSSGNPAAARPCFLAALARAEHAALDFYAVDAAHMLGIIEPKEEGLEWNGIAMRMAEASSDERTKGWLGSLMNNTAWIYFDMGEFTKSIELFEKDYAYRLSRNRPAEARIARYSIGKTMRALKRTEEALVLQLALNEEFVAVREEDGFVKEEIGECLLALDRAEEAKSWFAKAHALLAQDIWLSRNEPERIARLKKLAGA